MLIATMTQPLQAIAQKWTSGGGLFGWGPTVDSVEYYNRGLLDPSEGGYFIGTQHFGDDVNGGFNIFTQNFGQEAPLSGWFVLTLAGMAYAFKKRKDNNNK